MYEGKSFVSDIIVFKYNKENGVVDDNSMGLGLAMVKWISEIHNGEINVKSKVGFGTEFSFKFSKHREKK